jgi:hypothetical protein
MSKIQVSSSIILLWALPCSSCMTINGEVMSIALASETKELLTSAPSAIDFVLNRQPPISFWTLRQKHFVLSCLQVLGSSGYKPPIVATSDPFHLACHEKGQDLQELRLEMSSPYMCPTYIIWKEILKKISPTSTPTVKGRFFFGSTLSLPTGAFLASLSPRHACCLVY